MAACVPVSARSLYVNISSVTILNTFSSAMPPGLPYSTALPFSSSADSSRAPSG
eukprot:CAMPEP_0202869842 /NCGR_PEP_ID=MMETSP1391-20130828/13489_1 /ASSEMBLY_ACC=CAM_ASM_000867 /TAXON_ID=1034604 /ORGANISM="Chlamydomonas leiostraca, Strain SAG 11-49" /LENGTH=53 /DNA_ID=CAMNT_0049550229 /DNA_START=51 /DNA_END=209 /DNA_ORIENTATION=+